MPQPRDGGGFAPLPPGGPCDLVRHAVGARRWAALQPGRFLGGEAGVGVGEDLAVTDADGLQEALLAERQRDEVAELDELRLREVLVQPAPELVVRQAGVPGDGHRPGERGALAVIEPLGGLEVQDLVDLRLGGALLPGQHRALAAAVLAFDGLGDVEPAQFLDRVIGDALAEEGLPGVVERLHDRRVVQPDRLALRSRRAEQARALHDRRELGIGDGGGVDVADVSHWFLLTLIPDRT